jgi:hypothetical protein
MRTPFSEKMGKGLTEFLSKGDKPSLDEAVRDFLEKNPAPNDDEWHDWAESNGFNVHEAEAVAYALAGRFVKFLRGGRSKGKRPDGVSDEEIKLGIGIEAEHTDDPEAQQKITFDHLTEFKTYNTALKKMEGELGG